MNQLTQIFMYEGAQVRTVIVNGQPNWIAKDVCEILEIGNVTDALKRLDEDERNLVSIEGASNGLPVNAVTESGLYSLILGSKKPEAKPFKRWVTHEVLPTIRKHGAYMTPETIEKTILNPDFIIGLATQLKTEQSARIAAEIKLDEQKPLVLFAESLQVSKDSVLVADLAKLLKQNGIDMGEGRLFRWLRAEGYLIKSGSEYNQPTQRSMDLKIMEVKIGYRGSSDGTTKITRTPKITGKGQIYFINKFKEKSVTA
jgi:anti-repressor protein